MSKIPSNNAAVHWFCTLKLEQGDEAQQLDTVEKIKKVCQCQCATWVYQRERGTEENDYDHIQGYFQFKKKTRFHGIKKLWAEAGIPYADSCHWEICKDPVKAKVYCSKEDTRLGDDYYTNIRDQVTRLHAGDKPEKEGSRVVKSVTYDPAKLKLIKEEDFYPWQRELTDLLGTEADDRTINWYWDSEGGVGKSVWIRWALTKFKVCVGGGTADALLTLIARDLPDAPDGLDAVIWDLPRCKTRFDNYGTLEIIKNGFFSATRYEGAKVNMPYCHVIVFANMPPNLDMMSKDRWNVVCLDKYRKEIVAATAARKQAAVVVPME